MGNRWDARQRGSRYKDHVVGEGWQEPFSEVVREGEQEKTVTRYKSIIFNKAKSASSISVDDVENGEWPINFGPRYEGRSWRTRLAKWKSPATPMITNIRANPDKGLMAVTFGSDGAVIVYDHVPREIVAELQYTAQSGGSLGRLFWDLVRQRGTGYTKYPYWVAKEGQESAAQQARKRYYSPEEQQAVKVRANSALEVLRDPLIQQGVGEDKDFTDRVKDITMSLSAALDKEDYAAVESELKRYKALDID
jgi:hypothetical protein